MHDLSVFSDSGHSITLDTAATQESFWIIILKHGHCYPSQNGHLWFWSHRVMEPKPILQDALAWASMVYGLNPHLKAEGDHKASCLEGGWLVAYGLFLEGNFLHFLINWSPNGVLNLCKFSPAGPGMGKHWERSHSCFCSLCHDTVPAYPQLSVAFLNTLFFVLSIWIYILRVMLAINFMHLSDFKPYCECMKLMNNLISNVSHVTAHVKTIETEGRSPGYGENKGHYLRQAAG